MMARRLEFADAQAAAEACAEEMLRAIAAARNANSRVTVALSGGSSPKPMFAKMADAGFDWNGVEFFFVDERCVPPDHPDSNYRLAKEYLFEPAGIAGPRVHRIQGEIPPAEAAGLYAAELSGFFKESPPRFDIMHRGMGPDAHTASLFPGEPLIQDRTRIAAATYAPQFKQWRITLLPGVLLAAAQTFVLAPGGDKTEALAHVFGPEYDPMKYPAQLGMREGIEMTWYTTRPPR